MKNPSGFSLLELLVVLHLTAILIAMNFSSWSAWQAKRALDYLSHQFVQDAQLARALSVRLEKPVRLIPWGRDWQSGWQILAHDQVVHIFKNPHPQIRFSAQMRSSQGFKDISSKQHPYQLMFLQGEPAKLHNGGFVANRLIWEHRQYPHLAKHIILGPAGRFRICDPLRASCQ